MATSANSLKVFAFEIDGSGKRRFSVCHPETMWAFYQHLSQKHYYEVIAENVKCKLYFDLEFRTGLNPEVMDGSKHLDDFKKVVVRDLQNVFGDDVVATPQLLVLDSSTAYKFSWHLIVTNVYFANNYDAGSYVKNLCQRLRDDGSSLANFALKDDATTRGTFVDEGVYTKNRNFRIYLSSKFGKTAILHHHLGDDDKSVFMSSLITNVPPTAKALEPCTASPPPPPPDVARDRQTSSGRLAEQSSSPFPEIDNFIGSIVNVEGGHVRKWTSSPNGSFLTYEIAGSYKFCHNVNRHHRSNNIKFVVDVNKGGYFQACHDQDCKNFRSNLFPLPSSAMPWLLMTDDWE